MTEPHRALVARLSSDFAAISQYMARVSTDLTALDRLLSEQPPVAQPVPQPYPVPYWPQYQPQYAPPPPQAAPQQAVPPVQPVVPKAPRDEGWIGKLLAVAGVAVTLVGVVLLLVLAAQAGLLRPEFRVAAGGGLAVATGGSGRMAVPAARWTGRCHRPGRDGRRGGLHGRHRRHDHLRLGIRAGRPGRRRDHRRWRPDPGPSLGLSAPRCAGVGSAHRARARGGRRHHSAPGQLHVGACRRLSAGAIGQGLDLAALRSHQRPARFR